MISLRTLGSVELRTESGAQVETVLRQPKRLALLIYLALDGEAFHRRDRLLALFWPESDEKSARGALSQAVFQLRTALGKHVVVNRGDEELGIGQGTLWCDVAAFNQALERGEARAAMELYRGELLPSFTVSDAPEFENWVSDRRRGLAQRAADACLQIADEAERQQDDAATLKWLRRAVSLQPFYETAHQRLIATLDRTGDRAGALRAFEQLRRLLDQEFGVEPAAESLALMQAVRNRAEAGPAMVTRNGDNVRIAAAPFTDVAPLAKRRRISLIAFATVVMLALVVWGTLALRQPKAYHPPADHVAVLYFNDESPGRNLGYLTESLTSTLIDQLGQVHKLRVTSQNGVRQLRGSGVPIDSIARLLDAGTIVGGSVTESKDRLRVTVEMIDGATGAVMRSRTLERPNGELFALLDDLSNEVSSFLRSTVGQEVRVAEWRAQTRSVEAWRTLQEAEYLRSNAETSENSGNLSEAENLLARADSLAVRALDVDNRFASAIVLRGRIAERRGWLSFMTGQQQSAAAFLSLANDEADRALALDDKNAAAFELRGAVSYWRWILLMPPANGDSLLLASASDLRNALKMSADRPRAESMLSNVLYSQGEFAASRAAALRALEADAYLADADQIVVRLFETSFEIGDDVEAGHWCDEMRRRSAGHWQSAWCDLLLLAWSREGNHDPRKAMHLLETFGPSDPQPIHETMRPRLMAIAAAVIARAGMPDSASALLARARKQAPNDSELLHLEAEARIVMNDDATAVSLLRAYLKQNPRARQQVLQGRIFKRIAARIN